MAEEKELEEYCRIANGKRLPQNHLSFDLWEDKGKKHKYLCVAMSGVDDKAMELVEIVIVFID